MMSIFRSPTGPSLRRRLHDAALCATGALMVGIGAPAYAATDGLLALNQDCTTKLNAASYKAAQSVCSQAVERAAKTASGSAAQMRALRNLAALNRDLGHYEAAQPLLTQALATGENLVKRNDVTAAERHSNGQELIAVLSEFALLYQIEGRQTAAEQPLQRSVELTDQLNGNDSIEAANARYHLGLLYYDQHRYADAEVVLTQAVSIAEQRVGESDPTAVAMRETLARVEQELAASAAPGLSNTITPESRP